MQRGVAAPRKATIHEPIYLMRVGPTLREIKEGVLDGCRSGQAGRRADGARWDDTALRLCESGRDRILIPRCLRKIKVSFAAARHNSTDELTPAERQL
jgi:hypothetical protein